MSKVTKAIKILISMAIISPAIAESTSVSLKEAQVKLQQTYSKMNVSSFKEGPIPGTFELVTGNKVIYYHPEKELLIFGDIYDKTGKSITAASRDEIQKKNLKSLNRKVSLKMGEGEKTIIEFTDPDCGYCRKLNKFLEGKANVKREIYFYIPESMHPKAKAKAVHILCSKDVEKEFQRIFSNQIKEEDLVSCESGIEKLAEHSRISDSFGVSGTPTVILDDSVVIGFREAQIARYLE